MRMPTDSKPLLLKVTVIRVSYDQSCPQAAADSILPQSATQLTCTSLLFRRDKTLQRRIEVAQAIQ